MSVAEAVKKLRIKLCLEQEEFAKKIGISKAAICNYEQGKRIPRLSIVKKIKDFALENGIEITIEDFIE